MSLEPDKNPKKKVEVVAQWLHYWHETPGTDGTFQQWKLGRQTFYNAREAWSLGKLKSVRLVIYETKIIEKVEGVLHIPLAETIKELDNFILKGVYLYNHTKVFLWRTVNYYKPPMLCKLSRFVPVGTSSEYIP